MVGVSTPSLNLSLDFVCFCVTGQICKKLSYFLASEEAQVQVTCGNAQWRLLLI